MSCHAPAETDDSRFGRGVSVRGEVRWRWGIREYAGEIEDRAARALREELANCRAVREKDRTKVQVERARPPFVGDFVNWPVSVAASAPTGDMIKRIKPAMSFDRGCDGAGCCIGMSGIAALHDCLAGEFRSRFVAAGGVESHDDEVRARLVEGSGCGPAYARCSADDDDDFLEERGMHEEGNYDGGAMRASSSRICLAAA